MLLEFRLRNYRSFRDECALSMVASTDKDLAETNTFALTLPGIPRALRTAAVYGANASGKSNLLKALGLMRAVVAESFALQPGQHYNVQPFRLDDGTRTAPTMFEVTILIDGVRYQYGFEFTQQAIVAEWLDVYQKAKPQNWFDRTTDLKTGKVTVETGTHLTGQKRVWADATRANALFLSTAAQFNSEQLLPVFSWFANSLVVMPEGGLITPDFSTGYIQDAARKQAVVSMMAAADIAISAISTVQQRGFEHHVEFDPTGRPAARVQERDLLMPRFTHASGTVTAEFDYQDESFGSQKLFSLAGPLLDIIANRKVLVIDELDRSLHPLLMREIVRMFQDPRQWQSGGQLIFSTHDTSLMDPSFMRRDQFWFTEKHADQASVLVPLTEFSPRKGEALEKGYLGGRYGGVPILHDGLLNEGRRAQK